MELLITGTSGRLGSALAQCLAREHAIISLDVVPGPYTTHLGSVTDRAQVFALANGVDAILHTASLLPPHLRDHSRSAFVDIIVHGTLNLLESALKHTVRQFIYTSTTSLYGEAMVPRERVVWVTEELAPVPRDLYDVMKFAAEGLCRDVSATHGLSCVILRVARFFPEPPNHMAIYWLYKGVDLRDVVAAHRLALQAALPGCQVFNVAARSPFMADEMAELLHDPQRVILRHFPAAAERFVQLGWQFPTRIDRVYVIAKAERELGYRPAFNFVEYLAEAGHHSRERGCSRPDWG
jgi:UDP-glucose 4-epimerase